MQEALGRQLLVENPSTYLQFSGSAISEAEFLAAVVRQTGCAVLFDVNNIYVSASNQKHDAAQVMNGWCRALDARSVGEFHLAGHAVTTTASGDELRIDDHGDHVCEAVWALYDQALAHFGPKPTLLEWWRDIRNRRAVGTLGFGATGLRLRRDRIGGVLRLSTVPHALA